MVSIIIPNWNGRDLLEKNLPSILTAFETKSNKISEIIIVDDASTDDSVEYLKKNFAGKIKVVVHKINRGFSASVNTGVRTARSALVCLLNTDVLPAKNFLESVLPHFDKPQVFAVSLHEKGYGCAKGRFVDGFIGHAPGGEKNEAVDTFWANGGSAVFRRSMWMELRGMDEELYSPFYWEDIDLSYRAQKRGYQVLWEPDARVIHEHEVTVRKSKYSVKKRSLIQERNQLLFIWKNLTSSNLFKKHRAGLIKRMLRHPGYIRVVIAAFLKFGAVRKARIREKKESRVSDEAIFAKF